jgi:predicted nucleic acid-binding Zn ribbon protein
MSHSKPLNLLINQFLQNIGIKDKIDENLAIVHWDSVVGKEIADRTDPYKITRGTLFVRVADNVWRNELQFFKNEIIEKLNQKIGKKIINEIKFF